MGITKEQFDLVAAANPGVEIKAIEHDRLPDEIIIRSAPPGIWAIYQNLRDDGKKQEAREALVQGSVLFATEPDGEMGDINLDPKVQKAKLLRSIEKHPALYEVWAGEVCILTGLTNGTRQKKF